MKHAVQLILFVLSAVVTAGCLVGGTYARLLRGGFGRGTAPASSAVPAAGPALQAVLPLGAARTAGPAAVLPAAGAGGGRLTAVLWLLRAARCAGAGARLAAAFGRDRQAAGRGPPGGV